MRAWPVHLRAIAREHVVPDHRPARGDSLPVRYLLGVSEHFFHVVAGAEAQLLKGVLERHGSGSAEAGPNHSQRHWVTSPDRPKWV
jgi:hypothetical protein